MQVEILIPIAFFATVFGIVYIVVSAINKEKLAMIEKGLDASFFKDKPKSSHGRYLSLQFGLLLVGFALGLLVGNMLETYTSLEDEVAYFSMIFLFGGISLLTYYLIMKKLKPE
jgi:hypothetical protein